MIDHNLAAKISSELGELRGDVRAVLRELERDRSESREARARIYQRVEAVENKIVAVAEVAEEARDKVNSVDKVVSEDIKPQTDKFKRIGIRGGGFLAGAAMVGGAAAGPVWSQLKAFADAIFKNV